jgi:hypothetical protein
MIGRITAGGAATAGRTGFGSGFSTVAGIGGVGFSGGRSGFGGTGVATAGGVASSFCFSATLDATEAAALSTCE